MTEQTRVAFFVAQAFALIFARCSVQDAEVSAMQLHAALQDFAKACDSDLMKPMIDVEDKPFWEEHDEHVR